MQTTTRSKGRWIVGGLAVAGLALAGRAVLRTRRRTAASDGIPRDPATDGSLALMKEGHEFISRRCEELDTDVFETRLMLQEVICARGEEAARMFYVPGRFTRCRAMPQTALRLLQDVGSVQTLDGPAHRQRKAMFVELARPGRVAELVERMRREWLARLPRWQHDDRVVLHDQVREILCRAVCDWAGVPLPASQLRRRTRELAAMIEDAGSFGPRSWRGLWLQRRAERWIGRLVQAIRSGRIEGAPGSAAHAIAWHREPDGQLLEENAATVELINVLRPTLAVARFIVFAALALQEHPLWSARLRFGDAGELERFVQEVRRFYPFFPAVGGRSLLAFEWRGHRFARDTWVLLDLYGTNHDPRTWNDPDVFDPDRFVRHPPGAYDLVPQGGGDVLEGHRCPGEGITVELMKEAVRLLTSGMAYVVPAQDLRLSRWRTLPVPASGFAIARVRRAV